MEARRRQADRSGATRARLIAAARRLFAGRGYDAVGTEEIVRRAKVTRGALYHHFRDKRDLFRAVHEDVERELAGRIGARLGEGDDDPIEAMRIGIRAFLDACQEPEVARIALIDAPAVLGWEEWREVDAKYGLGLMTAGLELGMKGGALRRRPVRPLAHLLLGTMGEAAMMIANSADPDSTRAEVEAALLAVLDGLRS